jgi:hypothetical protein
MSKDAGPIETELKSMILRDSLSRFSIGIAVMDSFE